LLTKILWLVVLVFSSKGPIKQNNSELLFWLKAIRRFPMFLTRLYLKSYSSRQSCLKLMEMETNNSSASSCKAQKTSARSLASEASDSAAPSSPKPASQRKCCHHSSGSHHNSQRNNSGVYFLSHVRITKNFTKIVCK